MHEERVQAIRGTEEGEGGTEEKSKDGTEADPIEAAVGQDIMCPRLSDEVMARVKVKIDKKKRKERGAKKTKSALASKQKLPTTKTTTRNKTSKKGIT